MADTEDAVAANRRQVTQVLALAAQGDAAATDELLPLVYDELRRMARAHMANERAGQTLQPTALVHEAYLRLIGGSGDGKESWNSRGHFFGAAAQAMRRILVERARSRDRLKHGGDRQRVDLDEEGPTWLSDDDEVLALDEVLKRFEQHDPDRALVVMLRYFTGLTIEQTALALDTSVDRVKGDWAYARAWIHRELRRGERS
jgi:RNA polymerase sigma factor (TIGR02999 family)